MPTETEYKGRHDAQHEAPVRAPSSSLHRQELRALVTLAPDGEPTAVRIEPAAKSFRAEEERAMLCILKQLAGRSLLSLGRCEP